MYVVDAPAFTGSVTLPKSSVAAPEPFTGEISTWPFGSVTDMTRLSPVVMPPAILKSSCFTA